MAAEPGDRCSTHPELTAEYVTAHPLPADPMCRHCASLEVERGGRVLPLAARRHQAPDAAR